MFHSRLPDPVTKPYKPHIKTGLYLLMEEWRYMLPDHLGELVIFPGFIFDGASIPKVFWLTIGHPMSSELQGPALKHDALYGAELLPQKVADDQFYLDLRANKVGWYRAKKMHLAVRLYGGRVIAAHAPEEVEQNRHFCKLYRLLP